MAWQAAVDKFSLETVGEVQILQAKADTQTNTLQSKIANGSFGDAKVIKTFGAGSTDSVDYEVIASGTLAVALGTVNADGVLLNNITIGTSAAGAPTVKASGEFINDDAETGPIYTLASLAITPLHHPQIIGLAFTWTGDDCDIQDCTYTAKCNISRGTVEGDTKGWGINGGIEEVTGSWECTGAAVPAITPATGWIITAPLSGGNPDAGYTTWTITLQKVLAATRA